MDGEKLTELMTTIVVLLLLAGVGWMIRAASTGQLKRNAWVGLRTAALTHCDDCWMLGHHAAAPKASAGVLLGGLAMAAGGIATLFFPVPASVFPASLMLAVMMMLAGVLLGLKDANIMVAKMHAESSNPGS